MEKEFKSAAQIYFQEVKAFKPISPDEVTALFIRLEAARNQMIDGLCESPVTLQTISDWRDGLEKGTLALRDIMYDTASSSDIDNMGKQRTQKVINAFDGILALSANKDFSQVKPVLEELFRTMHFKMIILDDVAKNIIKKSVARDVLDGQEVCSSVPDAKIAVAKIKNGAREWAKAWDAILKANLRLVFYFANQYKNNDLQFDDLVQEGNMGLMTAVEKFDYRRGGKFSKYASFWIKRAMKITIDTQAPIISIPINVAVMMSQFNRASQKMCVKTGREMTPQELAEKFDLSLGKVHRILDSRKMVMSFATTIGDDDVTCFGDLIKDKNSPSSLNVLAAVQFKKAMAEVLSRLTPREERVVRMRFGIGEEREYTLEEVGNKLCLSGARVRQIEVAALGKLKNSPNTQKLHKVFMV